MEALVFDLKTKVLKHEKKHPMPEIVKDDDVIVKVAYSGVCGTDLHIMAGEFPARSDRPFTLGHEFSGVVHAAGPASAFRAGQKVVVDPNRPCNLCNHCRRSKYQFCAARANIGVWVDGGWAQYCVVSSLHVFLLPDGVSLAQGERVLLECAVVWRVS
uniref:Aldehyde reductase-7 n=1 Tax=Plutella xylostella TaxID=51655 RepID=A0A1L8D703_PLUXY